MSKWNKGTGKIDWKLASLIFIEALVAFLLVILWTTDLVFELII